MAIDYNINLLERNPLHNIGTPIENDYTLNYLYSEDTVDFFLKKDDSIISVKDCVEENKLLNPKIRQLIFVLGVNTEIELEQVYKNTNKTSLVVVIEPNFSLFTTALHTKKLSVFENGNVILFNNNLDQLQDFILELTTDFNNISLLNNICFYFTNYYRNNDFEVSRKIVSIIKNTIKSRVNLFGNSIEDSLEGLENNLRNILNIVASKNPNDLYNKFRDKPAVIIAAGPSLEKNLYLLKSIQTKVIIIVVDTVLKKVLKMGIKPHFVCSVERVPEVYEYFYKNVEIPKEVTLVAPPLIDSRIFNEYKGNWILPFRTEVGEYRWLYNVLEPKGKAEMLMGSSCAHVGFGLAVHLGASPIILIGQDLAFGEDEKQSHVSDTIYDEVAIEQSNEFFKETFVEGYYGNQVKTTDIWVMFKVWFEEVISKRKLNVIDATEGGAKILGAKQLSLVDTIKLYCKDEIKSVYDIVNTTSLYNFPKDIVKAKFVKELQQFVELKNEALQLFKEFNELKISPLTLKKNSKDIMNKLDSFDSFVKKSTKNYLMMHNIQGFIVKTSWDLSSIESTISPKNLNAKKAAYIKFLIVVASTSEKVEELLIKVIQKLENEIQEESTQQGEFKK